MVDTVSGLGSADYRHDEWGVDVSICGSQKGMMLPPGLGINALSPKAIEASKSAKSPKAFLAWDDIMEADKTGYWPTTPSINLLHGLHGAMEMLMTEGLENVFARHQRLASACRACSFRTGPGSQCLDAAAYSPVVTPESVDADALRKLILERYNLSLGTVPGKVKGRLFRTPHMVDCSARSLLAAISGCEMGRKAFGIRLKGSGAIAAQELLQ